MMQSEWREFRKAQACSSFEQIGAAIDSSFLKLSFSDSFLLTCDLTW